MASVAHLRQAYFVVAVLIAPPAKEFRRVSPRVVLAAGSDAGAANAVIFKRTGRLAPAVVLHAVYNAVMLA